MMSEGTETAEAIAYAAEESGNVDDSGNFSIEVEAHLACFACLFAMLSHCTPPVPPPPPPPLRFYCSRPPPSGRPSTGAQAGREAVPRFSHHARLHRPRCHGRRVVRSPLRSNTHTHTGTPRHC